MLEYFKDTLENMGLPEDLLEWGSNCVTQMVGGGGVKRELNRIGVKLSQPQSKTVSRI